MPVASEALSPSMVMLRVSSATSARSSTVAPPITSRSPQCAKRNGCSSRTMAALTEAITASSACIGS
jgi:hypothetical protein